MYLKVKEQNSGRINKKKYYTDIVSCKVGDQNNVSFDLLLRSIWKDMLQTGLPSITPSLWQKY